MEVETVATWPAIITVVRYGLYGRTLRDDGVDERDLFYYSSDWHLIEEHHVEHKGTPSTGVVTRIAQQFWGLRYIDDAVARRVDGDANGTYNHDGGAFEGLVPGEGTWFCLTDVQFSVVALTDDTAVLAERVAYDAYGRARHRWFSDLDGDGDSDYPDFLAQTGAASTSIHNTGYRPDADHDRDGDVDSGD